MATSIGASENNISVSKIRGIWSGTPQSSRVSFNTNLRSLTVNPAFTNTTAGTTFRLSDFRGKSAILPPLYIFTSWTFTNMGTSGTTGPSSITYTVTPWGDSSYFSLLNGIQKWTVPSSGSYQIIAAGATGGNNLGRGIIVSTTVTLTKGQVINILVGQKGVAYQGDRGGGGGGGSFVVYSNNTPILIAGGGGGGTGLYGAVGYDAIPDKTGANTGSAGQGGSGYYSAGGGGGLNGNGINSGGISFIGGGTGSSGDRGYGGFGCGGQAGNSSDISSGGGGGYSGGNAGNGGYGGGSYDINGSSNNATLYTALSGYSSGYNTDDGFVIITNTAISSTNSTTYFFVYSLRLITGYSGPVVRLRRSSDNAQQDFYTDANQSYFTTGAGNTGTSYTTWVGANTAYVVIWYDQSGNKNHCNNTNNNTTQPIISYQMSKYVIQFITSNATVLFISSPIIPYAIFTTLSQSQGGTMLSASLGTDRGYRLFNNSLNGNSNGNDAFYSAGGTKYNYVHGVSTVSLNNYNSWNIIAISTTSPINYNMVQVGTDSYDRAGRGLNGYMFEMYGFKNAVSATDCINYATTSPFYIIMVSSINAATNITSTSITCGTFNTIGGIYTNEIYSWRFVVKSSGQLISENADNVNFNRTISGLTPNTTYTYTVTLNATVSIDYTTSA